MFALLMILMLAALGSCDCEAEQQEKKKMEDEKEAKKRKFSFIVRVGIPLRPDRDRAQFLAEKLDILIGKPLRKTIGFGYIELMFPDESYSGARATAGRISAMLKKFGYKTMPERKADGNAFVELEERSEA